MSRYLCDTTTNQPDIFDLSLPQPVGVMSQIEFDSKTGYPSVINYAEIPELAGGITVYRFSNDRFSVDGIMFPRVIHLDRTTLYGDKVNYEMRIEEVRINPNLSLKDFEVPPR